MDDDTANLWVESYYQFSITPPLNDKTIMGFIGVISDTLAFFHMPRAAAISGDNLQQDTIHRSLYP